MDEPNNYIGSRINESCSKIWNEMSKVELGNKSTIKPNLDWYDNRRDAHTDYRGKFGLYESDFETNQYR